MARSDGDPLEVNRLREELSAMQRRLEQMENSTSMRLGRVLVNTANNPRRAKRLPREVLRMWRGRRRGGRAKARRAVEPDEAPRGDQMLLVGTAFLPTIPTSPVVAGVLREATLAELGEAGAVVGLLPHAALEMLERLRPDLVLIEAAAAIGPSAWMHVGDPAAADRLLALDRVRQWAAANDTPTVMWHNSPPHLSVFLDPVAARCDVVLAGPEGHGDRRWHAGVPLAGRVAWHQPREGAVVLGENDPVAGASRSALMASTLAALGDQLTRLADPDAPGSGVLPAPSLRRAHRPSQLARYAVAVANPFGASSGCPGAHPATLSALASGARVLTGPDPDLDILPGVHVVAEPGSAGDVVAAVLAAGPLTPTEHAAVLRHLHLHHCPGTQLRSLLSLATGEAAPPRRAEASLLADDLNDAAGALAHQTLLPREVLVHRAGWDADAETAVRRLGVDVEVLPDGVIPAGATGGPALVTGPLVDGNHLLDLEIVASSSGARSVAVDRAPRTTWNAAGGNTIPTLRWDIPA